MARIRTVKPEFFRHHDLYSAEIETKFPLRIAFAGLWTACDREGRFRWDPDCLKLDCLPYDKVDFARVLDALLTRGFIEKYASEGKEYGWIPSFSKHQVINNRERPSELPNPLDPTTSTRAPREGDACPTPLNLDQGEGKGRERKGREGKDASRDSSACAQEIYDYWKTHGALMNHRSLSPGDRVHIQAALKTFSEWELKQAIDRYSSVLEDRTGKYWLNTSWTIGEFVSVKSGKWLTVFNSENWENQVLSGKAKREMEKQYKPDLVGTGIKTIEDEELKRRRMEETERLFLGEE
jgi:hypothetical protein